MRKLFTILFFFINITSFATKHYVKVGGGGHVLWMSSRNAFRPRFVFAVRCLARCSAPRACKAARASTLFPFVWSGTNVGPSSPQGSSSSSSPENGAATRESCGRPPSRTPFSPMSAITCWRTTLRKRRCGGAPSAGGASTNAMLSNDRDREQAT